MFSPQAWFFIEAVMCKALPSPPSLAGYGHFPPMQQETAFQLALVPLLVEQLWPENCLALIRHSP